jgi:hypothetical protein
MGGIYILMVAGMYAGLLLIIMLVLAHGIAHFFLKNELPKKRLLSWTHAIYGIAVAAYIARVVQAYLS